MDPVSQIKTLLEEINGKLSYQAGDGKVISITEVLKDFPELASKHAELAARLDEIEKRTKERKWASMPGLEDEKEKFSLFKAIYAIATGDWSKAQLEADVFRQTRDMATQPDSSGGYLVPMQAMPELIELLRAEAVVFQLGATLLDNLSGSPVEIPKQTGGATAYWVGENEAITPSDAALGQLQLTPKSVGALVKLSNRLLRLSNPSAEAMVRADVAKVIALAIDLAALRGSGTANQPTGIANTVGINTVILGTSGAVPTFDLAWDMEYELALDNALTGRLGFLFHPAIKRVLCKQKIAQYSGDTGGEPIVSPMSDERLANVIGYPFKTTTQIPINLVKGGSSNCSEVYFANWSELIVAQWAGLEILPSKEAGDAFAKNQTWIRIITDVDVGVRHPESFCLCNDAKIA